MQSYFARCIRGLESLCERELRSLEGLDIKKKEIRTLFFTYPKEALDLVKLKSVDVVFLFLAKIEGLDHTRASLGKIEEGLASLAIDFPEVIQQIKKLRTLAAKPSFGLTVGLQGKKNFSRFELAERVLPFFKEKLGINYIPNEPASPAADLDFRISLEGENLYLGLRLEKKPLHRRPYKQHNRPGSTKAPLAYILASLAEIKAGDKVLDPCCGVGSILMEAATSFEAAQFFGTDINASAISSSKEHAKHLGLDIDLQEADAGNLPFESLFFDHIIVNPPWGRQVAKELDIPSLYERFFAEFSRLLKVGGNLICLTDQEDWMKNHLKSSKSFREIAHWDLSLFGSVVRIYQWEKG
ncbi:MAG: methyltransferase domain-containing protein [Bacteroidota bacterium]